MRITEVIVSSETGKGIIDVEFIQMDPRAKRHLFDVAVTDAQCKRRFIFILQPFVRVKADRPQVGNRGRLPVFKPDIDIDRR